MSTNNHQGPRLDLVRKSLKISQVRFSKRIGISQGYLNQVLKGRRNISYKILNEVSAAFPNVNTDWILTGEGEMFKSQQTRTVEPAQVISLEHRQPSVQELGEVILLVQAQNVELRRRMEALEKDVQNLKKEPT